MWGVYSNPVKTIFLDTEMGSNGSTTMPPPQLYIWPVHTVRIFVSDFKDNKYTIEGKTSVKMREKISLVFPCPQSNQCKHLGIISFSSVFFVQLSKAEVYLHMVFVFCVLFILLKHILMALRTLVGRRFNDSLAVFQ